MTEVNAKVGIMTQPEPDRGADQVEIGEPVSSEETDDIELLSFTLGGQDYAVDIMSVREIRNHTSPTPLPQTPDYVLGVINLRGTVLPILDLSKRLGLKKTDQGARAIFIVLKVDERLFGATVDTVSDILTVPRSALQEPPALSGDEVRSCVSDLFLDGDRMIRVLAVQDLAPRANNSNDLRSGATAA